MREQITISTDFLYGVVSVALFLGVMIGMLIANIGPR